jgi:hypothetical protein
LVSLINGIADSLTNQMVGNSECRQAGISQNAPAFLAVIWRLGSLINIKMVAPTGELQSVEAHLFGEGRKFCERKIGPLAGEEGYRSGHSYMQQNSHEHDKYKNRDSVVVDRPGASPASTASSSRTAGADVLLRGNVQNLEQLFYTRGDAGLVS